MAYTNLTNCTLTEYTNIIYSQDDVNRLRIWFNNVELQDADNYCEKVSVTSRVIPDDGSKRFTLGNFVAKEVEVIFHDVDTSIIQDQVRISIGTLVDEENDIYEDVPIGIFNIQDTPTTDKNKTTIKLRDNRVKFDFNYNAQPLMDENGGKATYSEILNDICTQANITNTIVAFEGQDIETAIYDNTISARDYVAYIAEQAGAVPTIDRQGRLAFVYLNNSYIWKIPLNLLEKYEIGKSFEIQRVVYESGIIKYETSSDESLNTLYIDSANPYVISNSQINAINTLLNGFEIDSVKTGKILGNPLIDSYDIIEVYGYYQQDEDGEEVFVDDENTIVFKTLANNTYTYTGANINEFDTQIGEEARTENVSINSEASLKKWVRTNIDNVNIQIETLTGETRALNEDVNGTPTYELFTDYTIGDTITGTVYELIDDEYTETEDTTYLANKDYYVKVNSGGLNNQIVTITNLVNQIQTTTYTKTQIQSITTGNNYFLTNDETYQSGTKYYVLVDNEYVLLIEGTDYEIGTAITGTVYEYGAVSNVSSEEINIDSSGMTVAHLNGEGVIDSPTEGTYNQYGVSLKEVNEGIVGDEIFFSGYVNDTRYGEVFKDATLVYVLNAIINGYLYVANNTGKFDEWTDDDGNTGPAMFLM